MIWSRLHQFRVDDADSFIHVTSFTRNHICNLASRFPYLVHKVFVVERIHAHHGLLATCWIVVFHQEYDDFVQEFMDAVKHAYGEKCLVQVFLALVNYGRYYFLSYV